MTDTLTFAIQSKSFPKRRLPADALDAVVLDAWRDSGRWQHGEIGGTTTSLYPPHTGDALCEHFGFRERRHTAVELLGRFLLLQPPGFGDYLLSRNGLNDGGKMMLQRIVDHVCAFDVYAHVGVWVHIMPNAIDTAPPSLVREVDTVSELLSTYIARDELVLVRLGGKYAPLTSSL